MRWNQQKPVLADTSTITLYWQGGSEQFLTVEDLMTAASRVQSKVYALAVYKYEEDLFEEYVPAATLLSLRSISKKGFVSLECNGLEIATLKSDDYIKRIMSTFLFERCGSSLKETSYFTRITT